MSNVTVFGFPRSTFVKVVRLILTAKDVDYRFHDTDDEMYLPIHLQRRHNVEPHRRSHEAEGETGEAGDQRGDKCRAEEQDGEKGRIEARNHALAPNVERAALAWAGPLDGEAALPP
jgi:hypothetical protein